MIQIDDPLAALLVFALLAVGLVVYPLLKTERCSITPSKVIALVIAAGICVYSGTLTLLLVFLWPLSFIWFPEFWGNYTGLIQGRYIDVKSPPLLVSWMGWFFLVVFPALLWWITRR